MMIKGGGERKAVRMEIEEREILGGDVDGFDWPFSDERFFVPCGA